MLSKEEIEKAYWEGYIAKQNEAMEICKQCKYIKKARELESDKQKLIEKLEEKEKLNDKYLQKLVYALSPTTHALGDNYNNAFKKIIAENIDLETCKIKRELKDCWDGRF